MRKLIFTFQKQRQLGKSSLQFEMLQHRYTVQQTQKIPGKKAKINPK